MDIEKKPPVQRRKGWSQRRNLSEDLEVENNFKKETWIWDSAGQVTTPSGPALLSVSLLSKLNLILMSRPWRQTEVGRSHGMSLSLLPLWLHRINLFLAFVILKILLKKLLEHKWEASLAHLSILIPSQLTTIEILESTEGKIQT